MAVDPEKAWFEHHRIGQRVKAVPVSPTGWIALMLLVAFPLAVVAGMMQVFPGIAPAGLVTVLIFSLVIDYALAMTVLKKRSRPRN